MHVAALELGECGLCRDLCIIERRCVDALIIAVLTVEVALISLAVAPRGRRPAPPVVRGSFARDAQPLHRAPD